jgi:hypothetical protein
LFTIPVPSNDRLYFFHYPGFQPSCHSINDYEVIEVWKVICWRGWIRNYK